MKTQFRFVNKHCVCLYSFGSRYLIISSLHRTTPIVLKFLLYNKRLHYITFILGQPKHPSLPQPSSNLMGSTLFLHNLNRLYDQINNPQVFRYTFYC